MRQGDGSPVSFGTSERDARTVLLSHNVSSNDGNCLKYLERERPRLFLKSKTRSIMKTLEDIYLEQVRNREIGAFATRK